MKNSLVIWGIILIAGFFASHWLLAQGYNPAWLWIAWAVIFNIGHYAVGKTMKKISKSMQQVWMMGGIFGLIVTLVVALDVVSLNLGFLMSFWFLIIGATLFAGGHESKDSAMIFGSMVLVFSSIFTLAFGNSYFLAGSLILGLLTLLHGVFMK